MGRTSDARDRLLHSARRLVHQNGYSAVSVADICEDAQVCKGSFYHFFPTKRDLVMETIDHFGNGTSDAMSRALDPQRPVKDQLKGMLEAFYRSQSKIVGDGECLRGCPIGNLALELSDSDEGIRRRLEGVLSRWQGHVELALRRARDNGEMSIEDPALAAQWFIAQIQGATLMAKVSNDPEVFRRLTARVVDALPMVSS